MSDIFSPRVICKKTPLDAVLTSAELKDFLDLSRCKQVGPIQRQDRICNKRSHQAFIALSQNLDFGQTVEVFAHHKRLDALAVGVIQNLKRNVVGHLGDADFNGMERKVVVALSPVCRFEQTLSIVDKGLE